MKKKEAWTVGIAALGLLLGPAPAPGGTEIVYEVTSLKGKLVRELADGKERLAAGDEATGGQRLRTGWLSQAELLAPDYGSRFHLGSRTRVRLASEAPGVLLELERGRLRAVFDKLMGESEVERRIGTPSAVLAVRGTEYGVAVDGSGATTVAVFSGTVEVLARAGGAAPVLVEAGFALHVRRGRSPDAPYRHGMTSRRWDRGAMPGRGQMSPGARAGRGGSGMPAGRGHGSSHGRHGG